MSVEVSKVRLPQQEIKYLENINKNKIRAPKELGSQRKLKAKHTCTHKHGKPKIGPCSPSKSLIEHFMPLHSPSKDPSRDPRLVFIARMHMSGHERHRSAKSENRIPTGTDSKIITVSSFLIVPAFVLMVLVVVLVVLGGSFRTGRSSGKLLLLPVHEKAAPPIPLSGPRNLVPGRLEASMRTWKRAHCTGHWIVTGQKLGNLNNSGNPYENTYKPINLIRRPH